MEKQLGKNIILCRRTKASVAANNSVRHAMIRLFAAFLVNKTSMSLPNNFVPSVIDLVVPFDKGSYAFS